MFMNNPVGFEMVIMSEGYEAVWRRYFEGTNKKSGEISPPLLRTKLYTWIWNYPPRRVSTVVGTIFDCASIAILDWINI
jgi:hypothetical protein